MLTQNDLQAIKKVVDKSIDDRVVPLEKKMEEGFKKSHKMDNDILGCLDKEDYRFA